MNNIWFVKEVIRLNFSSQAEGQKGGVSKRYVRWRLSAIEFGGSLLPVQHMDHSCTSHVFEIGVRFSKCSGVSSGVTR